MKALILVDRFHWAYHSITKAIEKYNSNSDLELSILPIKKGEKKIKKVYKKYDKFLVMGWQTYDRIKFLPKKETLVGIHSAHSWDDRKTTPEKDVKPPKKLIRFLNDFRAVNAVSYRLYKLFKKNGVKKMHYTPNGADSQIFTYHFAKNKEFAVGYSGSKAHDWRKGVSGFILPSAKKAKAKVKIAMLSSGDYVKLEEMPSFYHQIDTYICASSSEGYSLSVLEAASCGLPVISTRVGGCVDLIEDGKNGFLVDRDVNAIAEKITLLKENEALREKISKRIRQDIEKKWCWSIRVKDWIDFIYGA
tara:strand:- start:420 stop:1334 length:915 start_codon:yes stop_codon:yes gene_type:complete